MPEGGLKPPPSLPPLDSPKRRNRWQEFYNSPPPPYNRYAHPCKSSPKSCNRCEVCYPSAPKSCKSSPNHGNPREPTAQSSRNGYSSGAQPRITPGHSLKTNGTD